jgi:hypothetical protein
MLIVKMLRIKTKKLIDPIVAINQSKSVSVGHERARGVFGSSGCSGVRGCLGFDPALSPSSWAASDRGQRSQCRCTSERQLLSFDAKRAMNGAFLFSNRGWRK